LHHEFDFDALMFKGLGGITASITPGQQKRVCKSMSRTLANGAAVPIIDTMPS
jgi:hypothetical protein